ncbi:MAG: 30S ribosomal protein S8 [Syntrophorhabdales bacterium]|jgi:small subunit ribosomal protein S8
MVTTDPISDMLTRIRNAIMVRHEWVDMPYSTVKFSIAKLLKEEGYLRNYKVFVDESRMKFIKVYIGYDEHSRSLISGLTRISKPGRRVYVKALEIGRGRGKLGCAVVSTSRGLMTDKQAIGNRVGGELLFRVW